MIVTLGKTERHNHLNLTIMIKMKSTLKSTLLGVFGLLLSLSSLAQGPRPGYDPAFLGAIGAPAPIPGGVGAPYSLTFTIGNLGPSPITGANGANKMAFTLGLGKCEPATGQGNALASISGELLMYFDITYSPPTNTGGGGVYSGIQKQDVAIPRISGFDIYINTVVTVASSNTSINDIGISGNIQPNATANPQPTDNDNASYFTHTTNAPQPVSLMSFTAQAQTDRTVLLNWKTSWESTNKGYVIERSKDLKNFEAVGEVTDVAGTSNSINSYKFVDKSPYRGQSYYRLVQLDLDGSRHTYKAEPVVIDGRYGVYPNPVVGSAFTLELDEPATAVLHLYDVSGREVSVSKSDVTELSTKVSPSAQLSTGVYVLTVEERGTLRKHRLVVQ